MRIALTGSANVGKTTLFEALKNELKNYSFYPELAIQLIKEEPDLFLIIGKFKQRPFRQHPALEIMISVSDMAFVRVKNILLR